MKARIYLTTVIIAALAIIQHAMEIAFGMGCSGHMWVFIVGPLLGGTNWTYVKSICNHCKNCSDTHLTERD